MDKENTIEQTGKIPAEYFLFAAAGIMLFSFAQKLMNKNSRSLFPGQWMAPLLLFGVYNKIVKTAGQAAVQEEADKF